MYIKLFIKECSKTIKSIPYLILVLVLLIFGYTQIVPDFVALKIPQPNQQDFGTKYEENPDSIMSSAIQSLYNEFISNSYIAYPIGFYKNVKLNDRRQFEMSEILAVLTGESSDDLMKASGVEPEGKEIFIGDADEIQQAAEFHQNEDGSYQVVIPEDDTTGDNIAESAAISDVSVSENLTYEHFRELVEQADKLIGGGSHYCETYIDDFGQVPMTYEEALEEYNSILKNDKVTGAYARLFCDYYGIMLAVFPVFVAVALGMKDRRSKIRNLIFTRKISSTGIIFVRYLAMIVSMLIPVLLIAAYASFSVSAMYSGMDLDSFAFFKYAFGWLMPTLMISTSIGIFFTELTDSPIAIAIQGSWWFFDVFKGIKQLEGGYGLELSPRHNILGSTQVYLDNFSTLMNNRIIYVVLSILLVVMTVLIYEQKRRGRFDVCNIFKKIFRNRKGKCKA